jgi:hypothetical protein
VKVISFKTRTAALELVVLQVQELLLLSLELTVGLGIVNYFLEKYAEGKPKYRKYLQIGFIHLLMKS